MFLKREISGIFCLGLFFLIVAATLLMLPYLTVNFWYDDLSAHLLLAHMNRLHETYLSESVGIIGNGINSSGRLLLYIFIAVGIFLIQSAFFYHLTIVSLFVINIMLFAIILKKLNFSYSFICFNVLILMSLFHITDYHDPLASYAGLYQILGIFFCLASIALIRWAKTFSPLYLLLSVILIFFSLFMYEINLLYFPLAFFLILYYRKVVPLCRSLLILFIPLVIYLTVVLFMRFNAHEIGYSGVRFGDASLFLVTYLKQLTAVLPGFYYLVRGHYTYDLITMWHDFQINYWGWLLIFSATSVLFIFLRNSSKETKQDIKIYAVFLFLLLCSPVLVVMTQKYQSELIFGWGYLPIYYEAFFFSVLLTAFIFKLSNIRYMKLFVVPVVVVYLALNWMENLHNTDYLNDVFSEPSEALSHQLKNGLLQKVKDGDIINVKDDYSSVHGDLIYAVTGKRVIITGEPYNYVTAEHPKNYTLKNTGKINGRTVYEFFENDSKN